MRCVCYTLSCGLAEITRRASDLLSETKGHRLNSSVSCARFIHDDRRTIARVSSAHIDSRGSKIFCMNTALYTVVHSRKCGRKYCKEILRAGGYFASPFRYTHTPNPGSGELKLNSQRRETSELILQRQQKGVCLFAFVSVGMSHVRGTPDMIQPNAATSRLSNRDVTLRRPPRETQQT